MVKWHRNAEGTLKRERQPVTEEMKRSTNLARGDCPWWSARANWKIGTRLNQPAVIPLTWAAILCDAKPTVNYVAKDRSKQKRADIATAAFHEAALEMDLDQKVHDAELVAQVQKCSYLSLRPKVRGDQVTPDLIVFLGEQVWVDKNCTNPAKNAERLLCEYYEPYGSLCERFPGLRGKLARKYADQKNTEDGRNDRKTLSPPGSYNFSGLNPGGNSAPVTTPAYAGSPNPPEGASGSGGMKVQEWWTRPNRTIDVEEVQFLASGEPATRPKMWESEDGEEEPLRRITTEGGVVYELPESLVNALYDLADLDGGMKILEDRAALEVVTHKVKYPLYPDGRLVVIVDEDVEADDRMNPLGYVPFIKIAANSDPGGGYYGPSSVDLIADPYEQLVRMVSLVYDNANLMGNSIWRVWEGEPATNDDFTNAPGGLLRETINSLKYSKRESAPQLPNYVLAHIKFLVDQIKELSGLSDMATGKLPPKPQISTETHTNAQEASGVRFRDSLSSLSRAMRLLGEQYLEFAARFITAPMMVQVKNDAGVPEPVPMLAAYLTEPMMVEAKAGSRQRAGPSARLQTMLSLVGAGVPLPIQTVFDLLEELGTIPSATGAMREVERLKRLGPAEAWRLLMPPPPGQMSKKPTSKRAKKKPAGAVA